VLDELKLRYKELELAKRLAICALLALLPGIYTYFGESSTVDEEYEQADLQEKAAAQKLLTADKKLKNLEKTQSQLEFTKDQLKKAEARLPEQIAIDEVLRTVGKISKDMSVNVRFFEPQPQIIQGDEYKYVEVPIAIAAEAKDYGQICEWVDRVAGGRSKIYVKSWVLERGRVTKQNETRMTDAVPKTISPATLEYEQAVAARDNVKLIVRGQFSLFKMATSEQLAEAAKSAASSASPNAGDKGKVTNPPGASPTKASSKPDVTSDAKAQLRATLAPVEKVEELL
jgi:Tfp pilus assembly protein PilO